MSTVPNDPNGSKHGSPLANTAGAYFTGPLPQGVVYHDVPSHTASADGLRIALGLDPVGQRALGERLRVDLARSEQLREEALAETRQSHQTLSALRALLTRWQGYANEMATVRDDTARLLNAERHAHSNTRSLVKDLARTAERRHQRIQDMRATLDAYIEVMTEQHEALRWRSILKKVAGPVGINVGLENGKLKLYAWATTSRRGHVWSREF